MIEALPSGFRNIRWPPKTSGCFRPKSNIQFNHLLPRSGEGLPNSGLSDYPNIHVGNLGSVERLPCIAC